MVQSGIEPWSPGIMESIIPLYKFPVFYVIFRWDIYICIYKVIYICIYMKSIYIYIYIYIYMRIYFLNFYICDLSIFMIYDCEKINFIWPTLCPRTVSTRP